MPLEKENKKCIEYIRKNFTWGDIIKIHEISNIQIIECEFGEKKERQFCIYVDFEDTHTYAETLDDAIIMALSFKYDKSETAGIMFKRMLRME